MPKRIVLPEGELWECYEERGWPLRDCAKHFGVTVPCVVTNMRHYGIRIRDLSESHLGGHENQRLGIPERCSAKAAWDKFLEKKLRQRGTDAENHLEQALNESGCLDYVRELKVFTGDGGCGGRRFYAIDFAFPHAMLAVEVDGTSHGSRTRDRDRRKDRFLAGRGWTVLRFRNYTVLNRTKEVLATIMDALAEVKTGV